MYVDKVRGFISRNRGKEEPRIYEIPNDIDDDIRKDNWLINQ